MAGGKPNKYDTHIRPYLDRIQSWLERGATAKECAKKLDIAYSTWEKYLAKGRAGDERFEEFAEAYKHACAEPDDVVEAALFKRAHGYSYDEVTVEEKLDRNGEVHTLKKVIRKEVPADGNCAMFWLTNRQPERWKYSRTDDSKQDEDNGNTGVALLPEILPDTVPEDQSEGAAT